MVPFLDHPDLYPRLQRVTMRRTAFKQPARPERIPMAWPGVQHFAAPAVIQDVVMAQPKECAVRSEPYRRLVAAMACKACGISGYSQAAHPNTGKGAGIKADDRECFALCCDRPGVRGCHPQFDQGAMFSKAVRQAIEPVWAADTRRAIVAAGQWPANLPLYEPKQPISLIAHT
jgi:hypothetical protein